MHQGPGNVTAGASVNLAREVAQQRKVARGWSSPMRLKSRSQSEEGGG